MNTIGPPLHEDRPRVVAFGSGKGGTGKSTLCSDIARALARYNFRVLCIDASWQSPTLNIPLGTPEPSFSFRERGKQGLGDPDAHIAQFIVPTAYSEVYLCSIAAARRFPFSPPSIHADELLHQIHELDFDWVLIDLPAGISPLEVGLFTLSDIPILVTTPEPAAIRASTQFLRASLFRAIGYHPEGASVEGEILDMLYKQPLRLSTRELRYDAPSPESRTIIDDTLNRLETYVVVNLIREGAEHDLGYVLCHALFEELQLFPRLLASIDYADRRWFYNRRTTGIDSGRTEEGLTNDMEMLARNIRDISLIDMRYPRPLPTRGDVHPALLMGLNPQLSRNEIRQYCRRLWEGYRRETAVSLVFTDPARRMETAEKLELLYRQVLTMPSESFTSAEVDEASSRHQKSLGRTKKARTSPPQATQNPKDHEDRQEEFPPKVQRTRPKAPTPPPSEAPPREEALKPKREVNKSPGEMITRMRRELSLSLQELSSRTHIGVKYLAAIEDIDLDVLPRQVYLRGYLREIARVFDVDSSQLVDEYFRYLDES